jgi:hypothetical protein
MPCSTHQQQPDCTIRTPHRSATHGANSAGCLPRAQAQALSSAAAYPPPPPFAPPPPHPPPIPLCRCTCGACPPPRTRYSGARSATFTW